MEISAVGNIAAAGNITGAYLFGNGSQITGLPANYGNTEVASFLATFGSNTVSTTGNVTAGFLVGNISAATGGYGNANVQAVLQTYSGTLTAGSLSTTGNITGNFFLGNGSQLTGITASLSGNLVGNINGNGFGITNLTTLSASGNITGVHRGDGANLTGIPTSIVAGPGISVSAATGAVTITNNNPTPYGNTQVAAFLPTYSGALTAASVTATGNITGNRITGTHFGSGANLSNVVTSIAAGTGISVNASTGAITITNTGSVPGGSNLQLQYNNAGSLGGAPVNAVIGANAQLQMTGATSNKLTFGLAGAGSPTVDTYSPGAKVVLYDNISNVSTGYAIGIDPNTMWFGVDTAGSNFEYFVGNAKIAAIETNGSITANAVTYTGTAGTAGQVLTAGANGVTSFGNISSINNDLSVGGNLQVSGATTTVNSLRIGGTTPANSSAAGTQGQIAWGTVSGTSYLYVCIATNTWRRVALSTF
jgi:hypothetical protein